MNRYEKHKFQQRVFQLFNLSKGAKQEIIRPWCFLLTTLLDTVNSFLRGLYVFSPNFKKCNGQSDKNKKMASVKNISLNFGVYHPTIFGK